MIGAIDSFLSKREGQEIQTNDGGGNDPHIKIRGIGKRSYGLSHLISVFSALLFLHTV